MNTALVAAARSPACRRDASGVLLDRIGLAGQQRLVDEEVPRLEHAPVGGDQVPGGEAHDVARNDPVRWNLPWPAVADDRGPKRHRFLQLLGRLPGAVLLDEIQRHAHQHDGADDTKLATSPVKAEIAAGQQENDTSGLRNWDRNWSTIARSRAGGGRWGRRG